MKIKHTDHDHTTRWWHDLTGTCPDCGTVIQSEGTDSFRTTHFRARDAEKATYDCPECSGVITIHKPSGLKFTPAQLRRLA